MVMTQKRHFDLVGRSILGDFFFLGGGVVPRGLEPPGFRKHRRSLPTERDVTQSDQHHLFVANQADWRGMAR